MKTTNKKWPLRYVFLLVMALTSTALLANIPLSEYSQALFNNEGVSWKCQRCHRYNWKQNPPYTCSHCGAHKGSEK